jgi:flavin reductase (DIM6/NTAB) family NADH-FMN oxidoreductase RutF
MAMQVEPQALRAAMSSFPTGVTVVTAIGPDGPAGATANAVASLSLEPPMILACLDLGSRTLVAVEHAGRFAVNVLAADQAALARRFSTKDPHPTKWDGVRWTERAGSPIIEGALIRLGCELGDLHPGGDHVIAVGSVQELDAVDGAPLIFHEGQYRGLESGSGPGRDQAG